MKPRILSLSSLSLVSLLIAVPHVQAAFTIEPAVITFQANQGEKTVFVELVHTGGDPAAIQLSVFERTLDINGVFNRSEMPKSNDFVVHPSQVILYPKERANVQIQYKGKGKITTEKAYVLYSQEVPINVAKDDEGGNISVKMLTNYYTVISLDVGKPGRLIFVSSKAIGGGKIEVLAENKGLGRVKMDDLKLIVGGRYINEMTGNSNSVMPGQTRRFTFEWPRALTEKEVRFVY